MNAPFSPLYTNEASPEFLRSQDDYLFSREIEGVNEDVLRVIEQQQAYAKAHPPTAIYRVATEGSQTRNGGVIQRATSPWEFTLDNGQRVRGAQKGDYVVYADGSTAQIETASGQGNSHVALVGSVLSNGDEIINTPQGGLLFLAREGVPLAEDFLPILKT